MESMQLSEQETRLFNELFTMCDTENTGRVFGPKASELFMNSGLSTDTLHQIIDMCGAKRLGHFGRSQFYIALKMIALVQSGLPLTSESFNLGRDMPLPKFDLKKQVHTPRGSLTGQLPPPPQSKHMHSSQTGRTNLVFDQAILTNTATLNSHQQQQQQQQQQQVVVGVSATHEHQHHKTSPTDPQQQQQQPQHHPIHSSQSPPLSPQANSIQQPMFQPHVGAATPGKSHPHGTQSVPGNIQSNASGSGVVGHMKHTTHSHAMHHQQQQQMGASTTTVASGFNSYENPQMTQSMPHKLEKGWASFENDDDNQGLLSDQRKEWAHFTDSSKADTSSISSETDSLPDDVWHVTEEQREYYVNQFRTMQLDVTGLISGGIAKEFFEKSRLPISELSKIWQLSDVNKDGALNLEEFCTAMHLVVLRRNEIELPSHLPPSLVPYAPFANPDEPFASDLPKSSTIKRITPNSPSAVQPQWINAFGATIPESSASSSVSSPGQKPTPVNFDFKPIGVHDESEYHIEHPVPLRMSPDGQGFTVDQHGNQIPSNSQSQDLGGYNSQDLSPNDQLSPNARSAGHYTAKLIDIGGEPPPAAGTSQSHSGPSSSSTTTTIHNPVPIQPRVRPTPIKSQSVPSASSNAVTSSSHDNVVSTSTANSNTEGSQQQPPPTHAPPPSHPTTTAATTNTSGAVGEVPVPPPRKSHSRSASLDTSQLLDATDKAKATTTAPPIVPPRPKEGAVSSSEFSAVSSLSSQTKKLTPEHSGGGHDETDSTRHKVLPKQFSQEKKELQHQIKKQKEKNETLCRLNSELNQELQEFMEQRIALEIQMEHLRPYGGSYLYS